MAKFEYKPPIEPLASAGGNEKDKKEEKILMLKSVIDRRLNHPTRDNGPKNKPKKRAVLERNNVLGASQTLAMKKGGPPIVMSGAAITGDARIKRYPGRNNLETLRLLAWHSTVVYSIITFRRHQLTKRNIILIPKEKEPAARISLFDYDVNEIIYLPYLDDHEKEFLVKIFKRLDPEGIYRRKEKLIREKSEELTSNELKMLEYLNEKHWTFYMRRRNDTRQILRFLRNPDPYFSEESSWTYLLSMILEDLLTIDRGAIIKTRNNKGEIVALTPVDGATLMPKVNDEGFIESYVQVVDGHEFMREYDKKDVILFRMNYTPDRYSFGYGVPNMEVLYTTVLSDIYIDKGNLDYYRKGGSVPEGFLVVEPPGNTDEYVAFDKEFIDALQRQIQSIIMSDFTQIPLLSGGKFSWIDLKGKRRDMQFKELAEYLTRKICAVFQVSPQDVGVIADVNRSTAETQLSLTRSKGLETLAAIVSEAFTRGVIDEIRKEQDLKLWWEETDVNKEKEEWVYRQGQLQAGVITVNEFRAEQGRDPVPWGDVPFLGLKNWQPPQEEQQGGMPMIPGIGGLPVPEQPPPLNMQAPNKGATIPGQAPGTSMGTPKKPEVKSIYDLVEEAEKELEDVSPIVDNILLAGINDEVIESKKEVSLDDLVDKVTDELVSNAFVDKSGVIVTTDMWLNVPNVGKIMLHLLPASVRWEIVEEGEKEYTISVRVDSNWPKPGATNLKWLQNFYVLYPVIDYLGESFALLRVVDSQKEKDIEAVRLSDSKAVKNFFHELIDNPKLNDLSALYQMLSKTDDIDYKFELVKHFAKTCEDAVNTLINLANIIEDEHKNYLIKRINTLCGNKKGKFVEWIVSKQREAQEFMGNPVKDAEKTKESVNDYKDNDEFVRREVFKLLLLKNPWFLFQLKHAEKDDLDIVADFLGMDKDKFYVWVKQAHEIEEKSEEFLRKVADILEDEPPSINNGSYLFRELINHIMNYLGPTVGWNKAGRIQDIIRMAYSAIEDRADTSFDVYRRVIGLLNKAEVEALILLKRYETAVKQIISLVDSDDFLGEEDLKKVVERIAVNLDDIDSLEDLGERLAIEDDGLEIVYELANEMFEGREIEPFKLTLAKSVLASMSEEDADSGN